MLYARAATRAGELALAAHALLGAMPNAEQWADFLDFFCIEWVDAEGWTEVERAVRAGALPPAALRWPREVRTALWVVDGWDDGRALLRDIGSDEEIAVTAPGAEADLPRRAVLRARVLPVGDCWRFSGEPDVYEPMGVIARMDLHRAWQEGPEPELLARLSALRAGFLRQREERAAWIEHFGTDEVIFESARDLERRLAVFASYLLNDHAVPSLGGRTRASAFRESKGEDPKILQLTLGATLTGPGRPGAIFDEIEGIHFLPAYGELLACLRGESRDAAMVWAYLNDPGVTALPFRRAGSTAALARVLSVPDAPLEALLAPYKEFERRVAPSVFPGLED